MTAAVASRGAIRPRVVPTGILVSTLMIGITMPIIRHSFLIQHPLEIPRSIHGAFHIA